MNGEEATLEIKIDDSKLELGRLLGYKNNVVSHKMHAHVKEWFLNEYGNKNK